MIFEFLILSLAVFRISRLIVTDRISEPLRLRLLARFPSSETVFTEPGPGRFWAESLDGWAVEHPHWLGELVSCMWCVSWWISLIVTVGWWAAPTVIVWLAAPFALSAVVGLLAEVVDE